LSDTTPHVMQEVVLRSGVRYSR